MGLEADLLSVSSTINTAVADINALGVRWSAEIANRDAQIAALLLEVGSPPTPAVTLTSSLVTDGNGTWARISAQWNVDVVSVGRNGTDIFSSGTYSTPTVANQRTQNFDYCTSSTTYRITVTLADTSTAYADITTPTIPGGGGGGDGDSLVGFSLGVYKDNDVNGPAYFGGLVNHNVKISHTYCYSYVGAGTLNSYLGSGHRDWLLADSSRRMLFGIGGLVLEPGNFESTAIVDEMFAITDLAVAQGVGPQIILRFCYEMMGDWMGWGRQYPGNEHGQRYITMWRRVHAAVEARHPGVFEWDWCGDFWSSGDAITEGTLANNWFWPGDDVVDYIGSDNYDVYVYGDNNQRWAAILDRMQNQATFAANHPGIRCTQDEWALWNPNNASGGGDNPVYIAGMLNFMIDNDYAWGAYFDTYGNDDVRTTLAENPNGLAAFRNTMNTRIPSGG